MLQMITFWPCGKHDFGGAEERAVSWSWMPGVSHYVMCTHGLSGQEGAFLAYRGVVPTLSLCERNHHLQHELRWCSLSTGSFGSSTWSRTGAEQ